MSEPTVVERRLGRGPAFPVRPDLLRGDVQYRSGAEKVRQAIELVLRTEPGERLMRPRFGCPLRQFLMEPNTVATRSRLERAVTDALTAYEPRIKVDQVVASPGDDPSLIHLAIRYQHVLDGSEATLVYPFYLEV
ncbi:GPW/gp25 family protein [Nocardioides ginsengisoli]|uniref:GPW/gp25 family protein n=1 Tax=Nocardioides ginsengisoli TaxID=363868 RepID=A0ABW3VZB8_9ACTN